MQAYAPLRTPRAAGLAGVVFALLLATALVLLRLTLTPVARSGSVQVLVGEGKVAVAFSLAPFAGIAFLWFIGVVRDRIGQREDRFLATVCLGSGLLFVALLFVVSGVAAGTLAAAGATRSGVPAEAWTLGWAIATTLMNTYAMRMAAVFMISTSTIGLRTGFVPRGVALCGYAIAVVLLLGLVVTLWVQLLFPFWVLIVSLSILIDTFRGGSALEPPGKTSWEMKGEVRKSA